VELTDDDRRVVEAYAEWPDKGPVIDGRRLTIMAAKTAYRVDEVIRVVHVVEATDDAVSLYIMGPKDVHDECVDGPLRIRPLPDGQDPFVPTEYDGRVARGPALDSNYEVTTYAFREPGEHEVVWRLGGWTSNALRVTVGP
jgi:hypothetical protein